MLSLPERVRDIIRRQLERLASAEPRSGGARLGDGARVRVRTPSPRVGARRGGGRAGRGGADSPARTAQRGRAPGLHATTGCAKWRTARSSGRAAQALHRRVAEALATVHAGDLEPHHLALGLHDFEGEMWDKAVSISAARGQRRSIGSQSGRRWRASSARSPRSGTCPENTPRWSRASTFAWSCGRR